MATITMEMARRSFAVNEENLLLYGW